MGRYYSGDIEGKFAFGAQSSYAFEKFGAEPIDCYYFDDELKEEIVDDGMIEFVFEVSHLPKIVEKLNELRSILGPTFDLIESSEKGHLELTINGDIDWEDIENYADYKLGKKVFDFLMSGNKIKTCTIYAET